MSSVISLILQGIYRTLQFASLSMLLLLLLLVCCQWAPFSFVLIVFIIFKEKDGSST